VIDIDQTVPTDHLNGSDERVFGFPHFNLGLGHQRNEPDLGSEFTKKLGEDFDIDW
jgi:hypothetical protein